MNVKLTPEQERIINDELESGNFHTPEEVIGRALQALHQQVLTASTERKTSLAQKNAVDEMIAFVEKNHVRLSGISVKDLIHEGHRL